MQVITFDNTVPEYVSKFVNRKKVRFIRMVYCEGEYGYQYKTRGKWKYIPK
jgi:hypothetical protein